jgi:altronate dehydratase large subunit
MPDNIDFVVTGILERNEPVRAAGERLTRYALSVASGELTTSELLDTRDSAISRFGISM